MLLQCNHYLGHECLEDISWTYVSKIYSDPDNAKYFNDITFLREFTQFIDFDGLIVKLPIKLDEECVEYIMSYIKRTKSSKTYKDILQSILYCNKPKLSNDFLNKYYYDLIYATSTYFIYGYFEYDEHFLISHGTRLTMSKNDLHAYLKKEIYSGITLSKNIINDKGREFKCNGIKKFKNIVGFFEYSNNIENKIYYVTLS
jgi:hypothetical protein